MNAKIRLRGVSKRFVVKTEAGSRPFSALEGVDLDVAPGEFLCVVGPSGCGKSTLLDLVGGLDVPSAGQLLLDGAPITGPGPDRGLVFQQYALFPWRTALANAEFALEVQGTPAAERRRRALQCLDLVGLAGFEQRYPHELSGGMKQRVAIARSLVYAPQVLMMDEPFAALDAQTRESLQDELLRIWRRTGTTILFVTHGIDEAIYLGQRVAIMSGRPGRIKEVIEVPQALRERDTDDRRALPEFGQLRHRVWTSLREEVQRAGRSRGERAPLAVPVRREAGSAREVSLHGVL